MSLRRYFGFDRGLMTRALIANVVLVTICVLALTALFLLSQRRAIEAQLRLRAESLAGSLAGRGEFPMLVGNAGSLDQIASEGLLDEDVLLVAFVDATGHIVASQSRRGFRANDWPPDSESIQTTSSKRGYLLLAAPIKAPSSAGIAEWETGAHRKANLGSVRLAFSLEKGAALFAQTLRSAAALVLLSLAAILGVQFLQLKRIFLPLQDLIGFTEEVGRGNLALRAPAGRLDETGRLSAAFNRMLDQMGATTVSKNYVDRVLQSMDESLVVADNDGFIRTVNRATCEYLGYQSEELLGRHISTIAGDVDMRGSAAAEHTYLTRNGRPLSVQLSVSALRFDGAANEGVVVVAQDITERKRVQAELLAAKEAAEASSHAKSAFLANMSHELRTPLNVIIGYSEMLTEDAEASGSPLDRSLLKKDLRAITSAGHHLLTLVTDVLDLSKIEASRVELHPEVFVIGDLRDELRVAAEPLAKKNRNKLVIEREEDDREMRADLVKFRQCLLNLISNACKFTQDGIVTIEVRPYSAEGRHWLDWRVSDTGIGIPADQIHKLFAAFSQVDNSATRKHGGTGLGLAISRRFSELMGGKLLVESEPGRGSTFILRMPAELAGKTERDENSSDLELTPAAAREA